jgi:diacylglycerol kinase (ATP)
MVEQSNKPGATGLTRVINAFGYSMKGLRAAFKHEAAFRQELLLFIVMTPLALWLGSNGIEQALLIGSLFLVLIVELLNSAIEAIVDRVGSEFHELSGRAKDIGSAAVLLSLANVFVVWVLLLCDRLI